MQKIGIIGLGLIGGSIAKALKNNEIIAFDFDKESLELALKDGVINDYCLEINEKFCDVDILFVCTPVDLIYSHVEKASKFIKKECIVTDVGSVKHEIVSQIEEKLPNVNFVGGHPMTGLEKNGYISSIDTLFENSYYIVTKTEKTKDENVETLFNLIKELKAKPIIIDVKKHDFIVSTISHIPHIIAAGIVNLAEKLDSSELNMSLLAAGGFKDTTRIASSNPTLWQSICGQNKEEILKGLAEFKNIINDFEDSLIKNNKEEVLGYFNNAKQYRDSMAALDNTQRRGQPLKLRKE